MRLERHTWRVNRPKGHIVASNEAPTSQLYDVTATAIVGVRGDALLQRKVVRATGHAVPSNEYCIPSSRECPPMSGQDNSERTFRNQSLTSNREVQQHGVIAMVSEH